MTIGLRKIVVANGWRGLDRGIYGKAYCLRLGIPDKYGKGVVGVCRVWGEW